MTRKSIFHEDWWLDALAPEGWHETTCTRGGRVVGRLRYVERYRYGLKVCGMPQISRFLGPVIEALPGKTEARTRAIYSIVKELLEPLAAHDHVEMVLDTGFEDLTAFISSGYEVKVHPTLLLDCRRPIEDLWMGLRDKTRNIVRRAREQLTVREIDDVGQFIRFYEANLEGEECYFDLATLNALFAAASSRKQCKIVAAIDHHGFAHAEVFYIWDDTLLHYFLSTRNRKLAHPGAVSLLLWTGIELAHELGRDFDFDGGMTADEKYKFMIPFGGQPANRFEVRRSSPLYVAQRSLRQSARSWMNRIVPAPGNDTVRWLRKEAPAKVHRAVRKLARGAGRLPGVAHVLRKPAVRDSLMGMAGAKYLLSTTHPWDRVHPFDEVHGTDTSGLVTALRPGQTADEIAASASPYAGSQPSIVRQALSALHPLDTFTFLDLGCGKGRPLLVASEFPFLDIVGVELAESLAEATRRNAKLIHAAFPKRPPIRVVVGDASRFPLPAGNLVVFLYNPFGEELVTRVASAVNAAIEEPGRTVYVVYYNPVAGRIFDASPRLRRHYARTIPYAGEELGFGPDIEDHVVIWRGGTEQRPADPSSEASIAVVDPRSRVRLVATSCPRGDAAAGPSAA